MIWLHRFSAFFPPKTEGRLKIIPPNYPAWVALVGCLALTLHSSSSHSSSIWFKSADCASQDISWRTGCSSLLLIYFWQSLLVFRTLIRQSKRLYFSTLLPSLCGPWPIGAFWHYFTSPTVVSRQQFSHIGQHHSLLVRVDVNTFFSRHWFSCIMMFGVVSFLSQKLMTE